MSKRCARDECGKTVYPLEELKCLDKVWHKSCFKCTVCGMALNMKNYKGYNKMPYCEPHYPKTVASVVADTPEMRRIAENTKLQSQIAYHAEYEKMKGTKIQIADDPEISRHLANTKVQSQVAYTGELAKRIDQEQMRHHTQQTQEQGRKKLMEKHGISKESGKETDKPESDEKVAQKAEPNGPRGVPVFSGEPTYSSRMAQQSGTLIYSSELGGSLNQPNRAVGSIADYDPMNGNWGTVGGGAGTRASHSSNPDETNSSYTRSTSNAQRMAADIAHEFAARSNGGSAHASNSGSAGGAGFTVKAIYDYTAADKDEISFAEGDVIVNCQKVDDGWMTGTVQRTRQWGMLPANYVEPY
ncbi:unnamed protein product, partial [Mesorhabditis belari]|uniref:SH3 domain-containing protein n=1 Tax=Mesorhabditis belari TaxID=2138241 RepID=A0AAF3EAR3_9BILA